LIISDQGTHFKNVLLGRSTHLLGVGQKFTSPYASWSNWVVERMNIEVIRVFKALLSEHGVSTDNWYIFIPVAEYALNFAYRQRIKCSPSMLQTGVEKGRPLDVIISEEEGKPVVNQVNTQFALKQAEELRDFIREYSERAASAMREDFKRWREKGPKGNKIFEFEVGDLVLVASTKGQIAANKLRPVWQGPFKISKVISKYKYMVTNVADGREMERHAAFIRHYVDQALNLDAHVKAVIAEHQGELMISKIIGFGEDEDSQFLVNVQWEGLEDEYDDWQPLHEIHRDAPKLVEKAIHDMLSEDDRKALYAFLGI
jgi:thermostable 8-oxoguanine DNA glycosylase